MRHDRLKLVVPDDSANAATDGTTDDLPSTGDAGSRRAAAARRGRR